MTSPKQPNGHLVEAQVLGVDKVLFLWHVWARMKQRKITQDEVLKTLRHPTKTGLKTQPGRFRYRKTMSNYRDVEVVFEKYPDFLLVVTAWVRRGA